MSLHTILQASKRKIYPLANHRISVNCTNKSLSKDKNHIEIQVKIKRQMMSTMQRIIMEITVKNRATLKKMMMINKKIHMNNNSQNLSSNSRTQQMS